MRMHKYNIYRQFSELKWLKANPKEDEVILNVDFSKNYKNTQLHEIQRAYFGHENFTIFTGACYFHESIAVEHGKLDEESNLVKLPVAIISNETSHDRNVAFTNNNRLISMAKDIQYRTKRVQPNNANLVSLYKSAAFFQFREITM